MEQSAIFPKSLTTHQADKLLKKYGINEISEKRQFKAITAFFGQFNNVLTLLLIAAGLISFLIGEKIDSLFIFLIVILNAIFGFYQEFKAEKALSHLKKLTITTVRVIRDKKEKQIDSRYLVPGDIIYIEEGTRIPADCLIIDSRNLEVNEAPLTGESLPVVKDHHDEKNNQLFMGTVATRGRAYAQVLKTGNDTKFGQIAATLESIEGEKTPLQKKLEIFTKQIGIIGIIASVSVFILSFVKEKSLLESFIFGVSLAVAAIPEGLPAVMTITLAIGVERMAKKKAIVRKLNSIEALGSVTLIATDKTGTLTTNQMRVKKIFTDHSLYDISDPPSNQNHPFTKIIENSILCSTASLVEKMDHGSFDIIGDPTEGALLIMTQNVGISIDEVRKRWQIVDERPFNPTSKLMTIVGVNDKNKTIVYTKGAPESVLSICTHILIGNKLIPLEEDKRLKIEKEFEQFAKKGLRMIAFSYKENAAGELESKQIFLGFVGITDPIRDEIKSAVTKAKEAGIKVVMITGDNPLTAEAVAVEAGIIEEGEDIIIGEQLEKYSDDKLLPILKKTKVFARTSPQHKLRLVKLFQKQGEVVTVTGDGVNDALALKQADVGVAMGLTGTDVAKETAHMVITDDNFATLVNAIEEGRNIFKHIKNAIKYLLACNLGEVIYIITALIFNLPILTPLQLLYINLVTDGLPAISLAFAANDTNIMKEKPRRLLSILERRDFSYIFIIGLATASLGLIAIVPLTANENTHISTTVLFTTIIIIQQLVLVDLWLSHRPIFHHLKLLKQPIFILGFFFPFILHPFIIYLPFFSRVFSVTNLDPIHLIFSLIVSFLIFIPIEAQKGYIKIR